MLKLPQIIITLIVSAGLVLFGIRLTSGPVTVEITTENSTITRQSPPQTVPANTTLTTEQIPAPPPEPLKTEPIFIFDEPSQLLTQNTDHNFPVENLHLVSRFTTYHDCCGARVNNIQKMADIVKGSLLEPGEQFSLNNLVGKRTEDKGFLPAGSIMAGELVDTVGGGVSQFATTLYNAVFWAGLKDIFHQPHSRNFSRYPDGIEATISWPAPDLVFANDTRNPIVINTSYTDTSITVEIWGNNHGRIINGEHVNGESLIKVLAEGGPQATIVDSYVTPAFEVLDDIPSQTVPNSAIRSGFRKVLDPGKPGKVINVFRTRTTGDQEVVDTWRVVYQPIPRQIHVNPCDVSPKDRVHEYDKYDYSSFDCSVSQ